MASAEARAARRGPSLRLARRLIRDGGVPLVVGMDEVGRGALAGPVTVGAVAVCAHTPTGPRGLDDSKALTAEERQRLVPRLLRWGIGRGVAHATNDEIDRAGLLAALRAAGLRALARAMRATDSCPCLVAPGDAAFDVVLDGNYDWLRRPLLGGLHVGASQAAPKPRAVHLVVKGDATCAAVAAASVLAKVERDSLMAELAVREPRYAWEQNKGYAAPGHRAALRAHGPSALHRRSWRLGCVGEQEPLMLDCELV